ncbi:hypothetical protein GUJ93_ZPchr0009g1721 [Zizania palustris]|uniref:Uncharacterized protein n=1 Tax=Zizania palustris TaxID=103762 RepID=A0A8J5VMG2_ZIZPA|nr:hypothetical protein GUJ93_ZPchr0009g1721 [Zizania palustris]
MAPDLVTKLSSLATPTSLDYTLDYTASPFTDPDYYVPLPTPAIDSSQLIALIVQPNHTLDIVVPIPCSPPLPTREIVCDPSPVPAASTEVIYISDDDDEDDNDDDEMIDADGLADDDIEMELDNFLEDLEIAEAKPEQESEEEEPEEREYYSEDEEYYG